jgi:divalent metal cation (Fe/Co/Zn/Cd) transporter
MLGERMDEQLAIDIKKAIRQEPGIHGVYDLVLHNYGPDSYTGSVHIAVDETLSIDELDRKTRHITDRVKREFDVSLTGVGIYSVNGHDETVIACRNQVLEIALSEPHVEQVHGFYLNQVEKEIRFDVVVDFEAEDRLAVTERVVNKLKEIYPDFTFQVKTDTDFGMLTGNE